MPKFLITLQHLKEMLLLQGNFFFCKSSIDLATSPIIVSFGKFLPLAPSAFSTPKSPRCSQLAINVNVNWQFNYFQTIVMPIVHHFTQKPNKPQLQDSWHKPQ
jgi:hypothetical protein